MSHTWARWYVPRTPETWQTQADLSTWLWDEVSPLPPFTLADGSGPARQQTVTRVCYDDQALYVRFNCQDEDIWGTYTQRDEPLYDEEVVELFLAPGAEDPVSYYEIEVSPNGVIFDAQVYNPTSQRADMQVDLDWDCPGIRWEARRDDAARQWWATLVVPWAAVAPPGDLPIIWRANFYRIERPRSAEAEFSCWSPTLTQPADFHKPAYFGRLILAK